MPSQEVLDRIEKIMEIYNEFREKPAVTFDVAAMLTVAYWLRNIWFKISN